MEIYMTWHQAADLLHTTPEALARHARANMWHWMRAGPLVPVRQVEASRRALNTHLVPDEDEGRPAA